MEPRSDDSDLPRYLYPQVDREIGATAAEYALLVAFIAAVVIATVALLGDAIPGLYERVEWW